MPALDVLSQLLFSQNRSVFQKLYLQEQVVDIVSGAPSTIGIRHCSKLSPA